LTPLPEFGRRLIWFAGLWLVSVLSLAILAYAIKLILA
jgi:hypothetical protein